MSHVRDRCLGQTLQYAEAGQWVREKLDLMFAKANLKDSINRQGLAMAFGLVRLQWLKSCSF